MSWTITPRFTQWTPANITTALWLDAADASTITTVSGAVSQWNDKSGNSRNVTQATAANRPIYTAAGQNSRNVITFDGSNDVLSLASNLSLGTQHTILIAAQYAGGSTLPTTTAGELFGSGATEYTALAYGNWTTFFSNERLVYNTESTGNNGYGITSDRSSQILASLSFNQSGTLFRGRFNGASDFAAVNSNGGFSSTNYPKNIKNIGGGVATFNGPIFEIIVTASYESLDNVQKLEGYLAHKWGLTANLPADHPYKVNPPAP
jgi:hypothetical protein